MKIKIVIDSYQQDMFNVVNNHVTQQVAKSKIGRVLQNQVINHPKIGLATKGHDLDIDFFIKEVPRLIGEDTYAKPKEATIKKYLAELTGRIKQEQPDLVVVYGSWCANAICKQAGVKKQLYELMQINLAGFTTYFAFNPALRRLSALGSNEHDQLMIQNQMINRFLKGGIENTKPKFGEYQLLDTFDQVKQAFAYVNDLPNNHVVALDFETNTLNTYLDGAKAIMLSMSWKEHQGVSIPLEHKDYPDLWTKEQFDYIINWIKGFFDSPHWKVMHNASYDLTMLMDIYGLEHATNVLDTMLMYYELYTEEKGAQRGLKHLAYLFTEMGGYEDERDQAMAQYLQDAKDDWQELQEEKLKKGEIKKIVKSSYEPPKNGVDGSAFNFEWLPFDTLYKYASADTDVTLQLYHQFLPKVHEHRHWVDLVFNYYPKLVEALSYIQHTGFKVNRPKLQSYRDHFAKEQKEVVAKIGETVPEVKELEHQRQLLIQEREQIGEIKPADRTPEQQKKFRDYYKYQKVTNGVYGYQFNPGSREDVNYILYKMMGYTLPPKKEFLSDKYSRYAGKEDQITWKMYKADRKVALPYLREHYHEPLADLLLTYSDDKKMITGVADSYEELLDSDNIIHTKFSVTGTVTSRLASINPNLQNIKKPIKDVYNPNYKYPVKTLFMSRFENGYIFNIDYKSLEYFVAGLITKDLGLMQTLMDGADIHKANASKAFHTPINEVTSDQRFKAKSVGFGLLYGETEQGLAETLNSSLDEAKDTMQKVLGAMPTLARVIDAVHAFVEQQGYVETIRGHVRRLPDAKYGSYGNKARALRQSFNALVQGSGSNVTNTALIKIREVLRNYQSRVVATVHDSIVLDIHPDEVEVVPNLVKQLMEQVELPNFILNASDFPDLNIDPKYMINKTQFRFPLFAEIEFGHAYGEELDYDLDLIKQVGMNKYYDYAKQVKYLDDKLNTDLGNTQEEEQKEQLIKEHDVQAKQLKEQLVGEENASVSQTI